MRSKGKLGGCDEAKSPEKEHEYITKSDHQSLKSTTRSHSIGIVNKIIVR